MHDQNNFHFHESHYMFLQFCNFALSYNTNNSQDVLKQLTTYTVFCLKPWLCFIIFFFTISGGHQDINIIRFQSIQTFLNGL